MARPAFKDALAITRTAVAQTVRADVPGTGRRGVALLIALVTVAVLAALSTEFAYNTRTNVWMSGNIRAQTQALYHARTAMQIATFAVNAEKNIPEVKAALSLIGKGPQGKGFEVWPYACEMVQIFCTGKAVFFDMALLDFSNEKAVGVKSGGCECKVEAEDGRVNLNAAASGEGEVDAATLAALGGNTPGGATPPGARPPGNPRATVQKETARNTMAVQLYGLLRPFQDKGLIKDDRELYEIILNIMDWTDADDTKTDISPENKIVDGTGAEAGDYAQYDYMTKNAKMDTVGEVQLVEGMATEMYCSLRDKLTVFATDKINVNDADLSVLKGLLCQAIPEEEQIRLCWNYGLPSYVDKILYNIEGCRKLKKAVFSTPFGNPGSFMKTLKAAAAVVGQDTGEALALRSEAELISQIGTRAKMVRITAKGTYAWPRGYCAGGGGEGEGGGGGRQTCGEDKDCGEGGTCERRQVSKQMVGVIDTTSGALVHFHVE